MSHPITLLQTALIAALEADAALMALIGPGRVFDAPPRQAGPPYVAIARHEAIARDADLAPGHEHRILFHVRHDQPSRRAALEIAERVLAVATGAALSGGGLTVTLVAHLRTETGIDKRSGGALAAISLRVLSEPEQQEVL